jgi:hypothetical protein
MSPVSNLRAIFRFERPIRRPQTTFQKGNQIRSETISVHVHVHASRDSCQSLKANFSGRHRLQISREEIDAASLDLESFVWMAYTCILPGQLQIGATRCTPLYSNLFCFSLRVELILDSEKILLIFPPCGASRNQRTGFRGMKFRVTKRNLLALSDHHPNLIMATDYEVRSSHPLDNSECESIIPTFAVLVEIALIQSSKLEIWVILSFPDMFAQYRPSEDHGFMKQIVTSNRNFSNERFIHRMESLL